jgi:lipopolysaccharide transport system ATP-binding protein
MSRPAIRVEGLSKRYRISARKQRAKTLREALLGLVSSPFADLRTMIRPPSDEEVLWALRDISFEVAEGEVVGLVGPNGAGKSTLLKVLSRITEPTEGRAVLHGRVSSLLEVGTGFHRELSGRDNVYLNGAILGMRRREIDAKFDEIVAFSGLDTFMDTPAKRYSSGMIVRLAFAVAAHLEPEILLVDEVLAVGDAEFRKKCVGKMGKVAKSGRTVLFVSHNMAVVREVCPQSLWIDHGRIQRFGPSSEVIREYLQVLESTGGGAQTTFAAQKGQDFQVLEARILDVDGVVSEHHDCDQAIAVELRCLLDRPVIDLVGTLEIVGSDGMVVLFSETRDHPPNQLNALPLGEATVTVTLPARTLAPGEYQVAIRFTARSGFAVSSPGIVGRFRLEDHRTVVGNTRPGHLSTLLDWRIRG